MAAFVRREAIRNISARRSVSSPGSTPGARICRRIRMYCVIPSGGLSADHSRWVHPCYRFFLPVKVLSRVFRGKYLAQRLGGWSTIRIGKFYNGRDHSTVCNSIKRVETLRQSSIQLETPLNSLDEGNPTDPAQRRPTAAFDGAARDSVRRTDCVEKMRRRMHWPSACPAYSDSRGEWPQRHQGHVSPISLMGCGSPARGWTHQGPKIHRDRRWVSSWRTRHFVSLLRPVHHKMVVARPHFEHGVAGLHA